MSELIDPLNGTPIDPEFSAFLELSTPRGTATIRISQQTADLIAADPDGTVPGIDDPYIYDEDKYWGSYYNRSERGRLHGEYIKEILDYVRDPETVTTTGVGIFFDDQVIGGNGNNNPFSHNADDCDCNCNCNCNCDGDCNCDCNCG